MDLKKSRLKFVSATSDFDPPERELEPDFFDRSKDRRVTGPAPMAIDGDDKSAWGIDAGPGRRNQDRKAVFQLEKPIGFDGGAVLEIKLRQNHGGWNSDDLQNNNLGRFRISATTAAGAVVADPLPKRVRDILSLPRDQRSDEQVAEVFSYWRTTVADWKEANDAIQSLWSQWPEGTTQLTLIAREEGRQTHMLTRGLAETEQDGDAGRARISSSTAGGLPTEPAFVRALAG